MIMRTCRLWQPILKRRSCFSGLRMMISALERLIDLQEGQYGKIMAKTKGHKPTDGYQPSPIVELLKYEFGKLKESLRKDCKEDFPSADQPDTSQAQPDTSKAQPDTSKAQP
ncbi:unnamed protein product, partial [Mesorhabditis belari]|uniref:Uncharacterized protein n=1 Tax=Mesorhabditis belari TaxID=2138241 RepID=A0AAF3J4X8_9BILA